jgi:hypothetical protein
MANENEITKDSLDLLAAIMSNNAANAAAVSNSVTTYWAEQAKHMAELYIKLFTSVDKAADVVTTRRMEKVLAAGSRGLDTADRIIEGAAHVLDLFDPDNQED